MSCELLASFSGSVIFLVLFASGIFLDQRQNSHFSDQLNSKLEVQLLKIGFKIIQF